MNSEWIKAVQSQDMIEIKKEIQDQFMKEGMIMSAKWCQLDKTYKYLYLWNRYASAGALLYFSQDLEFVLADTKACFERRYPVRDNLCIQENLFLCSWTKANYFQWCSIIHEDRPEWFTDSLFSEWADKYRLYKLEKVFEN